MRGYSPSISNLIQAFARFPGIGPRTAERMVFYLLKSQPLEAHRMAELILRVKDRTFFCARCFNLSEKKFCHICSNESRDPAQILVVEEPKDIVAFEKSQTYKGLYHVLLGMISPQDGMGPDEIRIKELIERIDHDQVKELILATSARSEGEATAYYIAELLKDRDITVTRLARGIAVGQPLEFADQATLARALEGRQKITRQTTFLSSRP